MADEGAANVVTSIDVVIPNEPAEPLMAYQGHQKGASHQLKHGHERTQKISEFCELDAVMMLPSALTILIDLIVSRVRPHLRDVNPNPP